MITHERLKELFVYDLESGIFTRKVRMGGAYPAGTTAGCKTSKGYSRVMIDGKHYQTHRLAWLYVYGVFPENDIDHIDHDTLNNRISNLRDVFRSGNTQNQINAHSNNKSTGLIGTSFHKNRGKYVSQIQVDGKQKHLGCFLTAELAHAAYVSAKRKLHPTGML